MILAMLLLVWVVLIRVCVTGADAGMGGAHHAIGGAHTR